jgi:DnaJ-class molecular chaperone
MSRCSKCGCQIESPFDGRTKIHDEIVCSAFAAPSGSRDPCPDCDGTGIARASEDIHRYAWRCFTCKGTGRVNDKRSHGANDTKL